MASSWILLLHICSGTLGMVSGFVAVFLRKGSRRHAVAGKVFVLSMLSLASTGVYMAFTKSQPGNILGGGLTFYLVATAWITAKRRGRVINAFDWCALLVGIAVFVANTILGVEAACSPAGVKFGYSSGPYFFLGSVAFIAVAGDLRMLVAGGVSDRRRIARHLWRMCFALFIAAASIFLARQHRFPAVVRKTGVLIFLSFLPLLLMIFWWVRVRLTHARQRKARVPRVDVYGPALERATSLPYETQLG